MDGRYGRWLLLGTALVQAAAPPLVGFAADSADPPLVPPGGFFAIWGVVVLGGVAAAGWGMPLRRATAAPYRAVQLPVSLAQVGFLAWLVAAGSPLRWLTVPIFLGMLGALGYSLRRVLGTPTDRITYALLGGTLGVYAGWSTAAVWINTATLLPRGTLTGASGVVVQCAFVAAAAAAACAGARMFGGQAPYTLATAWALIGVTVSALAGGLPLLAGTAVAGLTAVGAVAWLSRRDSLARHA